VKGAIPVAVDSGCIYQQLLIKATVCADKWEGITQVELARRPANAVTSIAFGKKGNDAVMP
jgi:hypothetical protein